MYTYSHKRTENILLVFCYIIHIASANDIEKVFHSLTNHYFNESLSKKPTSN